MVLTFLAECQQYCNYEKLPPIAKYIVKVMKTLPKKLASQFNSGFIIGEKSIWNSEKALADIINFNDINYATIYNSFAKTIAPILSRILKTLYDNGYMT